MTRLAPGSNATSATWPILRRFRAWRSAGSGRPHLRAFYASPVVIDRRVFVGSASGRFYALGANTGALIWSYPPLPQPPLIGSCGSVGDVQAFGAYGVLSSASPYKDAIIFGAPDPDPSVDGGRGSGRLFALDQATGALVWKTDVVARVNGCSFGATGEQHVRWIADVPHNGFGGYSLGAPTVTHGIFYITTDQGHVVAIADPAVAPPAGVRCSRVTISVASCTALAGTLVYAPAVLADVALTEGADTAGLRNEPAIANGHLFVTTQGGHVEMLSP